MATLERIHFVPHYLVRRENAVAYSPVAAGHPLRACPKSFGQTMHLGGGKPVGSGASNDW